MIHKKEGLKLLGLLTVVVLGVMTFAPSAQALTPEFLINKKTPAAGLNATYEVKQLGTNRLLVPALNADINCTSLSVSEGIISTSIDANGSFLFENCTVLVNSTKEEAAGCEIVTSHEGGIQKHHIAATALFLPAELKNGEPALLAEKIAATVLIKEGMGCVLPQTTTIKGELCIKIDNNDTKELLLLSSQTIQGECKEREALEALGKEVTSAGVKDKLLFGAQEAFIDFDVDLSLTGAHKELTLGVSLQAQVLTPQFLINKKLSPVGLNATYSAKQLGTGTLLIPTLNTEVNCTAFKVLEGIISTSTDANGAFLFENCTVLVSSTKEEAAGCEIVTSHEGGIQKHHIAATALFLPAELKNGEPALLAEKIVAKVLTKPEQGCVLPQTTTIKGELCIKIDNNDTKELLLLSSQTIQGECKEREALEALGKEVTSAGVKDLLAFGAQDSFVDFNTDLSLTGAHKELTLGVSLQ